MVASVDECIELAQSLEQQRAVKIAEAVRASVSRPDAGPYWAGFDQACEEIIYRLKTEEWVLTAPTLLAGAAADGRGGG